MRHGVEGLFILSFPLISYTLGQMQGQVIKNELYPVWTMFIAIFFAGTNAKSMKLHCDYLLFMFYVGSISVVFTTTGMVLPYSGYIVVAMIFLLPNKSMERLALYMKQEHQLSTSYNPHTMQGYKYMVLIHEGTIFGEGGVTLEKIWSGNIGVLSSSGGQHVCHLKDVCLSFSLFHLVLDKTRVLVLDGLLQTEQDYERAFQVIEAEMAFLYDFFFTKYAFIMYGREVRCCAISLATTILVIGVGIVSLSVLDPNVSILTDLLVKTSTQDIIVTKIVLGALSIFQLVEIWSYCVSDWAKVSLVCKYVLNPSWQGNAHIEKLILLLGRPHRWLRYWRNNIGQYSVLDFFTSSYWDRLVQLFHIRKSGKPIELSMEVKKAVARTIKNSINGHLSSGISTLMKHDMSDEVCWACQVSDEFTLTHIILVWHVATSYCEIFETVRHPDENDMHPNKVVATSLSKYCAYLVSFAPGLLPGSSVEAECVLDELVGEAKEAFQNLTLPREKYEKLRELHNAGIRESTISAQLLTKGAILGKSLENMGNDTVRWDLLADFWAEMMVYIAPSSNVSGHIELLAQGGEFVTHVWALLMHAGILERPAAATTAVP
ncbi:hypothetical protein VPH35_055143 [Triticum aestivum]